MKVFGSNLHYLYTEQIKLYGEEEQEKNLFHFIGMYWDILNKKKIGIGG